MVQILPHPARDAEGIERAAATSKRDRFFVGSDVATEDRIIARWQDAIASQWKRTLMSDEHLINAASQQSTTATALKAKIEVLQAEIAKVERLMVDHQTEFRTTQERDRAEHLMAELLRMTADLMTAQEAVTRLVGELSALRSMRSSRPWWWRMLAG